MNEYWFPRRPPQDNQRLVCPYCDGSGHRCDQCDGDGWLWADEAPERPLNPSAEIFDARC